MYRTHRRALVLRRLAAPGLAALLVTGLAACNGASSAQGSDDVSVSSVATADTGTDDDASDETDPSDGGTTGDDGGTAGNGTAGDDDFGAVGPLDSSEVHELSVSFDQAEYDAMIETYSSSREKEWIEATVTIDGETYERAGIRLKGNSSLQALAGGGRGAASDISSDDPASLPWLIKLDKYVEQDHDGLTELVVRSNNSETALNEAVALELLDLAGLASQDAVAAGFSVNGSDPVLRLVIDNPEDEWMAEEFDDSGALYKAESTGDWSYRGDDPEAYDEVFDQEAGTDNADLTPLIELLDFVNNADDATFAAELPERLDVDSFATYLAMQDLLDNFDDIDGPGNNAYLYYDTGTGQFTIVPWDFNLAFGQGMGGGGGGAFPGGRPGADGATAPGLPEGVEPPDGAQVPGDGQVPGGADGRMPGGFGRSNPLVERFLAVDEWNALYEQRVEELRDTLFTSGQASEVLEQWTRIVSSSGLVDQATVDAEAAAIAAKLV